MSTRAATRLAWSLCVLPLTLTGLSLLLLNLSYPTLISTTPGSTIPLRRISYAPVGALIASRRPANPVGWLLRHFGFAISPL